MDELIDFLNNQYPYGPFTILSRMQTNGQRKAYCLEGPGGKLVAKVTDPGRAEGVVRADVRTPQYLSGQGFPAPRPLAARDGQLYLPFGDRFVYLYEYIEGGHPKPREVFYHRLGGLLGRLHSIAPDGQVPQSDYTPPNILADSRDMLKRAKSFLGDPGDLAPEALPKIVPELLEMIERFPSFEALPSGIIHTDPYLVNLIEAPGGELFLIDWEDGGISYPLLDVGYVLAHLCSFTARDRRIWDVPGPAEGIVSRPDWGRVFMAAYETARPLTSLERALLPDAVRLSFLAYMVEWGSDGLILDNYLRMKSFDHPGLYP
jgi:Ser/Thr protein kinase RdoA (MazF antagonist)